MKMTRKMSKERIFWKWFPLFFSICTLVLSIIYVVTDLLFLKYIVWTMIYIVPWLLFQQETKIANDHWNDWCREAGRVCDYMIASNRILIMLNNIDDEKIREQLLKEYGAIMKECIIDGDKNDTSEL